MARKPGLQRRLQAEVDDLFARIGDRPMKYRDLRTLPFLTRVTMETLRLWNVVPKGPRREFQFDDVLKGPNGEDVPVKKGTTFAVPHVVIHKNPEYWGDSADEYNPDVRDFSSKAFMPFTLPPRDCIGRNFALMEVGQALVVSMALLLLTPPSSSVALCAQMKTMMITLLSRYTFSLEVPDEVKIGDSEDGVLGPENGLMVRIAKRVGAGGVALGVPQEVTA